MTGWGLGLVVLTLVVVVGLVATVGLVLRRGRPPGPDPADAPTVRGPSAGRPTGAVDPGPNRTRRDLRPVGPAEQGRPAGVLPRDLAAMPDGVALLQLSSEFCASCRASRAVLTDVAAETPGVVFREVDVAVRPELVRLLAIRRTPTTLVVDAGGTELGRVVGVPRRAALVAVLAPHVGPTGRARTDRAG